MRKIDDTAKCVVIERLEAAGVRIGTSPGHNGPINVLRRPVSTCVLGISAL